MLAVAPSKKVTGQIRTPVAMISGHQLISYIRFLGRLVLLTYSYY